MEGKKISFGFSKTKKAVKSVTEEKKEFIESIEEKSIKIVGGEEIKENTPLVIPMKPNTLITAERLKEIAEKVESGIEETEPSDKPPSAKEKPPENETLEQMAVRELLENAKKEVKVDTPQLTVPLPPKTVTDGEKESTLEDYESVPIQDFGLAMLRGMGWTPTNDKSKYKQPTLRPKGLGLGADKVVKDNQKKNQSHKDGKDEELSIVKNAYVKVTSGKYTGYYGKVVSLDEDNGRVMVDIAVKKETVSLSEFMMHPVSKSEFDKESKVINADTYEKYKNNESKSLKSENRHESTNRRNASEKDGSSSSCRDEKRENDGKQREERSKRDERREGKEEKYEIRERDDRKRNDRNERDDNRVDYKQRYESNERKERERDRSNRERLDTSDERYKRKPKRYSSNESLSSIDEKTNNKKVVSKKYSSNDSLSSIEEKYSKKKDRKRYDSESSDTEMYKKKERKCSSDSEFEHKNKKEAKRDIDKKRKGKKKKRDRDRSPHYRKHKK